MRNIDLVPRVLMYEQGGGGILLNVKCLSQRGNFCIWRIKTVYDFGSCLTAYSVSFCEMSLELYQY